ncbi:hypothetical protein EDD22DRAFT_957537 [Suillus occidentalis]|nr:hypothetical protein EDD22DRAFT_957537 [Suillus occidentalis]
MTQHCAAKYFLIANGRIQMFVGLYVALVEGKKCEPGSLEFRNELRKLAGLKDATLANHLSDYQHGFEKGKLADFVAGELGKGASSSTSAYLGMMGTLATVLLSPVLLIRIPNNMLIWDWEEDQHQWPNIWQLLFYSHARARYWRFVTMPPSRMPIPPKSLSSFPFLTFVDMESNRPSRALAWANKDVLDFYDFAHDKGMAIQTDETTAPFDRIFLAQSLQHLDVRIAFSLSSLDMLLP